MNYLIQSFDFLIQGFDFMVEIKSKPKRNINLSVLPDLVEQSSANVMARKLTNDTQSFIIQQFYMKCQMTLSSGHNHFLQFMVMWYNLLPRAIFNSSSIPRTMDTRRLIP